MNTTYTMFLHALLIVVLMNAVRTLAPAPETWQGQVVLPGGAGRIAAQRSAIAPVRIALIAEDPITGEGMALYLKSRREVLVLEAERRHEAEIFLMVVNVITEETLKVMAAAARDNEAARFVLVGDEMREHQFLRAVSHGMVSILPRRAADFERVLQAVLNLRDGRLEVPTDAVGWLAGQLRSVQRDVLEPNGLSSAGLAPREVEVLGMLADGMDTAAIAQRLNYSERTVKNVVYAVMTRLNLRNRVHAVAFAIRHGAI